MLRVLPPYINLTINHYQRIIKDNRPNGKQVIQFTQQDNRVPLNVIHQHFQGLLFTTFRAQEWDIEEMELIDLTIRGDGVWIKVKRE